MLQMIQAQFSQKLRTTEDFSSHTLFPTNLKIAQLPEPLQPTVYRYVREQTGMKQCSRKFFSDMLREYEGLNVAYRWCAWADRLWSAGTGHAYAQSSGTVCETPMLVERDRKLLLLGTAISDRRDKSQITPAREKLHESGG